eukprot:jgi/Chrzof1/9878/Cz04g19120.t1
MLTAYTIPEEAHMPNDTVLANSTSRKCMVHSTRTCRALTRADVRGEAEQTDRQTYETVSNLQSPTHTY